MHESVCRGETRATEWKRLHNVSRCDVLLTIVVYIRGGVLFGVPFDPVRLEIRGTPTHLLDNVAADPGTAAGRFDFSRTGTFIYESGAGLTPCMVAWLTADGRTSPLLGKPAQPDSSRCRA